MDWLMDQLIDWFTNRTLGFLDFALGLLTNLAFMVPDVTVLPYTRAIWGQNMTIVNTIYILAIIAAGVIAMTHDSIQTQYGVKELLPRVFLGAIAANFSFAFLHLVLRFGDALITALVGDPLGGEGTREAVEMHVTSALISPTDAVLSLVLALMAVLLLIVLSVQWYVRFGILLVLAMVAPLALASYCLPGLDQAAGMWWRTLLGTLGTQALQALMVVGGFRVFLDPQTQTVLPLPIGPGGQLATVGSPVNLLIMVVILWATYRVAPLMRRWVLRGGGGSGVGRLAVVLLVHQVTRRFSGGKGAARVRS